MGSGHGGQHRNRTYSCVYAKHKPTGIVVKCDGRNQHRNRAEATKELTNKVFELYNSKKQQRQNEKRKNQVGSEYRGDKIRTYNVKQDLVVDHITGRKVSLKNVYKGKLRLLRRAD